MTSAMTAVLALPTRASVAACEQDRACTDCLSWVQAACVAVGLSAEQRRRLGLLGHGCTTLPALSLPAAADPSDQTAGSVWQQG